MKIVTSFVYPPIPTRSFDWTAVTDDYDGAPDAGPQFIGHGETEGEAVADLMAQIEDMRPDHQCPRCGVANPDHLDLDGCRDPSCPEPAR